MTGHTVVRATTGSAVALALALGAAGCTSGGSSKASSAGLPNAGGTRAAAAAATSVAAAPAAGAASAAAPAPSAAAASSAAPANNGVLEGRPAFQADPTAGRSIIYTATVNVQVDTTKAVSLRADEAEQDVQANGGYVFSRSGQAADTTAVIPGQKAAPVGVAAADITMKVPPATYRTLLDQLEKLGNLLSVDEHSNDVTDQVVDSESRLSILKASVARVRTLLGKATKIGEIVSVEGELSRREADLEAMEGRLTVLKAQSALATVTLHLSSAPPKAVVVPPAPKPKPKPPIHGFLSGLKAGGRGFATVAIGVATVVGAVLPFAGVLLVVALLAWWFRRAWLKTRRHEATAP